MPARALVTGGCGFVGTHLVRRLVSMGRHVVSLGGHRGSRQLVPGAHYIFGDLSQHTLETVDFVPDIVFHLAGGASVAASVQDSPADFLKTVFSTVQLLDYLRRHWAASTLVYASSAAVYGQATQRTADHATPCLPISPYGVHKKQVESLLVDHGRLFGTRSLIIRPFSVYGPGLHKQLLWDALQKADRGEFAFFGSGHELRDWVYVEDLVDFFLRASPFASAAVPLFNAGTSVAVPVRQVLAQLFHAAGIHHPPTFLGKPKEGDPDRLVADGPPPPALENVFTTSLNDGLEAYVQWYRQRGPA